MDSEHFDEKELERLFFDKKKKPSKFKKFMKVFLGFVSLYSIVFIFINFSGIINNISYWYKTEYLNQTYSGSSSINELSALTKSSSITTANKSIIPNIPDNYLKIELIDISAPITWRVENSPEEVKRNLEKGLIHLSGTALPGEVGNIFITGHSSDFPWSRGSYKNVFVLLNKLSVGDVIQLKYQNKNFLYKVSSITIVPSTDLSVLESKNSSTLTLMTCTPVGTTLRRLIVAADQIYPEALKNTKQKENTEQKSMPRPR